MNKIRIDKVSLINNYLPADYLDSFSRKVIARKNITPDTFFDMVFSQLPCWVNWLLKLRNILVKPLGLDTESRISDQVSERNENEIIWGMADKHLNFHVSMWCGSHKNGKQELRITTVVKYNNLIGKLYFFIIRPFHKIIIYSMLKYFGKRIVKI